MNEILEPKRRFVNSPTVYMEYEKDKEGYDSFLDDGSKKPKVKDYVEREEDKDGVDGSESLRTRLNTFYGTNVTLNEVNGAEGFMGNIKEGFVKLIKKVKDFFKWMWEYFISRSSRVNKKIEALTTKLKSQGVKENTEIAYPANAGRIYTLPRNKKPLNNLSWMDASLRYLEDMVNGTKSFNSAANTLLKDVVSKDLKPGAATVKIYDLAVKAFADKAGQEQTVINTFGNFQLIFRPKDKFLTITSLNAIASGNKFKTNLQTVTSMLTRVERIAKQYTANVNDAKTIEKTVLEELNKLNKSDESGGNKMSNQDAVRNVITRVMETIRQTNDVAYKGLQSATDILMATIK